MKKFRIEKISKEDVYVRYLIAALLLIFLFTSDLRGFAFYVLMIFGSLLVYTGIVGKSFLKTKFYPNK